MGDSEAGKFPEPKATYALAVSVLDKHLAVENEYLQALQKFWPEALEERRALYTPFQQKLAATNYEEEAANVETKRTFAVGQTIMLWSADPLISLSRSATEEAARWWLQKLELEKKKL